MLTPRIIADMRAGDECADPDYPGLRVRRTNAAQAEVMQWLASRPLVELNGHDAVERRRRAAEPVGK